MLRRFNPGAPFDPALIITLVPVLTPFVELLPVRVMLLLGVRTQRSPPQVRLQGRFNLRYCL